MLLLLYSHGHMVVGYSIFIYTYGIGGGGGQNFEFQYCGVFRQTNVLGVRTLWILSFGVITGLK